MKRLVPEPHTLLVSFHYAKKWPLGDLPHLRIVGDSGAYTARMQGTEISVDDLGEWAAAWRHRLFWVAALDVAGDQPTTRRNWETMNREYRLESVPSIHFGDDPHMLDYYASRGCDFVGLGGLAGGGAGEKASFRWIINVMRYAEKAWPGMRFHGWGMTSDKIMRFPFWSVDSSSWGAGFRYGRVSLRDPRTGRQREMRCDGHDAFTPENSRLLTDYYGVHPESVAVSKSETRCALVRLSAASKMCQETRMRQMHRPGITAPRWGIMNDMGKPTDGPNMVLADASLNNLYNLCGDDRRSVRR